MNFKKGDKVRITRKSKDVWFCFEIGEICTVLGYSRNGSLHLSKDKTEQFVPVDCVEKVYERKEEKEMIQKNLNPKNKVIVYNNRAVAYFDENGKKFTSVCDEKDEFDLEKGIAMAILKSKGINYTTVKELARTRKVYKSKEKNPKVA